MVAQDTAIDAYAAEAMNDKERPTGTSIINWLAGVAGVAGGGTVTLVERFGWMSTMLAASSLLLLAVTPAMIRREHPPPEARRTRQARGDRANILLTLLRPESLYILPFAFCWGFGAGFMGPMMGAFYADKGLTLTEYGIFPLAGFVSSTLTAIATPLLVEKIGLRRTALIGVCVMPIEVAMFCAFALMSLPPLPVLLVMLVTMMGFLTVPFHLSGHHFALSLGIQGAGRHRLRAPVESLQVSASRRGHVRYRLSRRRGGLGVLLSRLRACSR